MPYKFATKSQDYSDLSSGRVLYNLPGHPAFPVRLISEIFQRAQTHLSVEQLYTVYDPCCGAAYHLTVLGYLHGKHIQTIIASDIDREAIHTAVRNLGLLNPNGLQQRITELKQLFNDYRKESHREALQSARRLESLLTLPLIQTDTFTADVFETAALQAGLNGRIPDLIFADVPYGQQSTWQHAAEEIPPVWQLLQSMYPLTAHHTVIAIAADKEQKISHEQYQRLEKFQIGKRQITFLRKILK